MVVLLALVWPSRGSACSCGVLTIWNSWPDADATDVPIDFAPVIEGVFDPTSLRFQDASGHDVTFTLNQGPGFYCGTTRGQWAELVPQQPLAPHTRYSVLLAPAAAGGANVEGPTSLSFTTGDTRVPERALARPEAMASVVSDVPPSSFGCPGEPTYVCLFVQDPQEIELIARRGGEMQLRWLMPRIDSAGSPLEDAITRGQAPDCLEFRRRSANGQRSEPLTLCGDQLSARSFRDGDFDASEVLVCRGGKVGADAPPVPAQSGAAAHALVSPPPAADGGSDVPPAPASSCSVLMSRRSANRLEPFVITLATALLLSRRRKR